MRARSSNKQGSRKSSAPSSATSLPQRSAGDPPAPSSYRELIDNLDQAVFTLSPDGKIRAANRCLREILGVTSRGLIGRRLDEFVASPTREEVRAVLTELGKSGFWAGSVPVRLKQNGVLRRFECRFRALVKGGEIAVIIATARDVTDTKAMEQQLARSEKFAAMGQMLAGAAHELNNPLTAILGIADLLRERAADDAMRRHVEIVLQQARRAATIVQDLLVFSRPQPRERTPLQLEELVKQIVAPQRAPLHERNIRVNFHADGDIPPVEGDGKLLAQAIHSIVLNAHQAISAGRGEGLVDISVASRDGQVRVTIADDGPGIPAENIKKIFDPFFTTKRPGGGSGLGLTICLAVIKDHGGRIEVESSTGRGAAFHVLLPSAIEAPAETAPDTSHASAAASRSVSSRLQTVLVVDDEESILQMVREGLRARGMKVETAKTCAEGLAQLARGGFDAVVCDLHLPDSSGEQLYEKANRELREPPSRFILMTGDLADSETLEQLRRKGVCKLQKPFRLSALAALLRDSTPDSDPVEPARPAEPSLV